jgi:hypothetical protein
VIGAEEAKDGKIIWILEWKGKQFNCNPTGTREENIKNLQDIEHHIGKYMEFKFLELTNTGLPRHANSLSFRDEFN